MHALFELARAEAQKPSAKYPGQKAGCVVFIDEIDAVCKARGEGASEGSGADRKVTNQFLQEVRRSSARADEARACAHALPGASKGLVELR